MQLENKLFSFILFLLFIGGNAQPYIDITNFNYQTFLAEHKANSSVRNNTEIFTLNIFLPKEMKSGNTLLFRINGETIQSYVSPRPNEDTRVSGVSIPIGYQRLSENKKWISVVMGIPKLASDFRGAINNKDFQYGMLFIENHKCNAYLQIKAGLYINKEAFGYFWVPLIGVDWKATDKLHCFGILPTNYKIEYTIAKRKWYAGINFKAFTRSFQLSESENNDYIRFDEVVLKGFVEYYCLKNMVAYAEMGSLLRRGPTQFKANSNELTYSSQNNPQTDNYSLLSFGLAYRIRTD